jgi:lysyl-tRNA synthetase class 2
MQCYLSKGDVGDEAYVQFNQLVDIGDFVGVEGFTFITKRGEKSIHIKKLTPLSKALRPLPDKWHGIADRRSSIASATSTSFPMIAAARSS